MVTEKLIAAAMASGKTPKEIAEAVNAAMSAEGQAALVRVEMDAAEKEYRKRMQLLETKLADVKSKCPHLMTTYHPDPSGNSDSYYECDSCGKTI